MNCATCCAKFMNITITISLLKNKRPAGQLVDDVDYEMDLAGTGRLSALTNGDLPEQYLRNLHEQTSSKIDSKTFRKRCSVVGRTLTVHGKVAVLKRQLPENPVSYTKHLWGQEYIGIYPMMDNNKVWWGCSDIDVNDIDQARNIQLALKLKND
jgi:hypothetical protein